MRTVIQYSIWGIGLFMVFFLILGSKKKSLISFFLQNEYFYIQQAFYSIKSLGIVHK